MRFSKKNSLNKLQEKKKKKFYSNKILLKRNKDRKREEKMSPNLSARYFFQNGKFLQNVKSPIFQKQNPFLFWLKKLT